MKYFFLLLFKKNTEKKSLKENGIGEEKGERL